MKRTEIVKVTFTPEELTKIKAHAYILGSNPTVYIRSLALAALPEEKPAPVVKVEKPKGPQALPGNEMTQLEAAAKGFPIIFHPCPHCGHKGADFYIQMRQGNWYTCQGCHDEFLPVPVEV